MTASICRLLLPALLLVAACSEPPRDPARTIADADPESGRLMMEYYACGSCHTIPGIRNADGVVGPPLMFFSRRSLFAGSIPNNADNLVRFLLDPQAVRPDTAMPDVGATEPEARDMAAYLYTLE
ncbi:MAG TPA: cytochrome C [Gammaproteobacteria bacterium]|nr:cytochrome C [Gammaproteobacteria bacterium]